MGSVSPAQLSHDDDDGEEDNPVANMTMKDILSSLRGRKRSGIPMPSTVERLKQRRKKRREERKQRSANGAAEKDGLAEDAAATSGDKEAAPVDETVQAGSAQDSQVALASDEEGEATGSAHSRDASKGPDGADADEVEAELGNKEGSPLAEPVVVAPKVTVDENGNIVIDKESLCISASTGPGADIAGAEVVTVDSNDASRHITSATFAKRDTATKWTPEDSEKFFNALSRFGTDFALIEHAFPKRSRRQIKLKFKREERDNPEKVDHYLKARTSMTIADTRKTLNLDRMPQQHSAAAVGGDQPASLVSGDKGEEANPSTGELGASNGVGERDAITENDKRLRDDVDDDDDSDSDNSQVVDKDSGAGLTPSAATRSAPAEATAGSAGMVAPAPAILEEEAEDHYLY